MRLLWLVPLFLLPMVGADAHLGAPEGLVVEPANQALRIRWQAVPDADATGYYVYVYAGGRLVTSPDATNWTLDVPSTHATFPGAVNGRPYAVVVAAHDATGAPGARSVPVGATPRLAQDSAYLAIGLIVIWAGLWAYALLLARSQRRIESRIDHLLSERRRHGDRP